MSSLRFASYRKRLRGGDYFTPFISAGTMDITVRRTNDESTWSLEDLLGRAMGTITEHAPKQFIICPEGNAADTMRGLSPGPYGSLDAALAEIETHTRGVCRMDIDHGE